MRSKTVMLALTIMSGYFLAACSTTAAPAKTPPVRAQYIRRGEGKPPLIFHSVRLTLLNQQDHSVWFVLPFWGDKPLPRNGLFPNTSLWTDKPFRGKLAQGEGGSAVEVTMYGGDGFNAFRLPAKGSLELDGYIVEASKDINEIVVLEAQALKVNSKTPLEKWLPYGTMCGQKVKVSDTALNIDWTNLDWDPEQSRSREDYPKETIKEVKAEGCRYWAVKFERQEGKKAP